MPVLAQVPFGGHDLVDLAAAPVLVAAPPLGLWVHEQIQNAKTMKPGWQDTWIPEPTSTTHKSKRDVDIPNPTEEPWTTRGYLPDPTEESWRTRGYLPEPTTSDESRNTEMPYYTGTASYDEPWWVQTIGTDEPWETEEPSIIVKRSIPTTTIHDVMVAQKTCRKCTKSMTTHAPTILHTSTQDLDAVLSQCTTRGCPSHFILDHWSTSTAMKTITLPTTIGPTSTKYLDPADFRKARESCLANNCGTPFVIPNYVEVPKTLYDYNSLPRYDPDPTAVSTSFGLSSEDYTRTDIPVPTDFPNSAAVTQLLDLSSEVAVTSKKNLYGGEMHYSTEAAYNTIRSSTHSTTSTSSSTSWPHRTKTRTRMPWQAPHTVESSSEPCSEDATSTSHTTSSTVTTSQSVSSTHTPVTFSPVASTVTIEHTAPVITVDHTAPTVTVEHTAPAVTMEYTAPAVTVEHTAPAVTVEHTAPAVTIEHTAPAVTVEYTAPAVTIEHTAPVVTSISTAISTSWNMLPMPIIPVTIPTTITEISIQSYDPSYWTSVDPVMHTRPGSQSASVLMSQASSSASQSRASNYLPRSLISLSSTKVTPSILSSPYVPPDPSTVTVIALSPTPSSHIHSFTRPRPYSYSVVSKIIPPPVTIETGSAMETPHTRSQYSTNWLSSSLRQTIPSSTGPSILSQPTLHTVSSPSSAAAPTSRVSSSKDSCHCADTNCHASACGMTESHPTQSHAGHTAGCASRKSHTANSLPSHSTWKGMSILSPPYTSRESGTKFEPSSTLIATDAPSSKRPCHKTHSSASSVVSTSSSISSAVLPKHHTSKSNTTPCTTKENQHTTATTVKPCATTQPICDSEDQECPRHHSDHCHAPEPKYITKTVLSTTCIGKETVTVASIFTMIADQLSEPSMTTVEVTEIPPTKATVTQSHTRTVWHTVSITSDVGPSSVRPLGSRFLPSVTGTPMTTIPTANSGEVVYHTVRPPVSPLAGTGSAYDIYKYSDNSATTSIGEAGAKDDGTDNAPPYASKKPLLSNNTPALTPTYAACLLTFIAMFCFFL